MKVQRETTAKQSLLTISGDITIYQMMDASHLLLDSDEGLDRQVLLDLQQIEELDTAGLQLLLMMKRHVEDCGGSMQVVSLSESVANVVDVLRCREMLNVQEAQA
jgi:anti-anti-sigma factor